MKFIGIFVSCVALLVASANGYKILGIFPTASPSHHITGNALMKGLAAAGHEVTVISPFPHTKPLQNYRAVTLDGVLEKLDAFKPNLLDLHKIGHLDMATMMFELGTLVTNCTLLHDTIQAFLRDPAEHFDVIIVEIFLTDALIGFGQHYKAPVIGFASFGASKWTTDLVGTPSQLSYVPHTFLPFTSHMTFVQRIGNTLMALMDEIVMHFYLHAQNELYDRAFPGQNKPDLFALRKNVSLVLLNNHFSLNHPRPYVPNMIEIGGVHISRAAARPLPTDVQQFIDSSSEHGVIYFSMGSNIQSSQLPISVRDDLLRTFSKLKQKVLWKWEDPNLPGKPDNVLISKWFPQDDVLAHPNIRLFITHGGLLSCTEAVYHGIPIIGIPVFGDQSLNTAKAVDNGYGLLVSFTNLTETSISWALNEVLGNDKYAKKAKIISARYRDQPLTPMETGVYWVEYVARHKGAPHLHSAGQDLSWIAYHNLDVYALLVLTLYAFYWITKFLFFRIWNNIFKKTPALSDKKKKN